MADTTIPTQPNRNGAPVFRLHYGVPGARSGAKARFVDNRYRVEQLRWYYRQLRWCDRVSASTARMVILGVICNALTPLTPLYETA